MNRRGRLTGTLVGLVLAGALRASAEGASPAELRLLLTLSGTENTLRPVLTQIVDSARQLAEATARSAMKSTGRPADEGQLKRLALASSDPEKLIAIIAEVYGRHFTKQEVQQLLEFYRTPIGRKLAVHQGILNEEMLEAAQAWVRDQMAAAARSASGRPDTVAGPLR